MSRREECIKMAENYRERRPSPARRQSHGDIFGWHLFRFAEFAFSAVSKRRMSAESALGCARHENDAPFVRVSVRFALSGDENKMLSNAKADFESANAQKAANKMPTNNAIL